MTGFSTNALATPRPGSADVDLNEAILVAREGIYRYLAGALADPRESSKGRATWPTDLEWLGAAAELLRDEAGTDAPPLGFGETPPERLRFGLLWTLQHDLTDDDWRAEYERVFGLMSCRECPPFETEFFPNHEPFFRSQQLADIAGFYQAFGLRVPANRSRRADHLELELEFMAFLLGKERRATTPEQAEVCQQAARTFFADHLAWWVPSFTRGLRAKAQDGYFAELAQVLSAFITLERCRWGLPAPTVPMTPKPDADAGDTAEGCTGCTNHAT